MFLKNKNIIFKIRRSKVTEYAALTYVLGAQKNSHIERILLNTHNKYFA